MACQKAGFGARNFCKEVHLIGSSDLCADAIDVAIEKSYDDYGSIPEMVKHIKPGSMVDVYILKRIPFSDDSEMWDNVIVRFDEPPTFSITGYDQRIPLIENTD